MCRQDFNEYISTCPEYADNWEINRKCLNEPASFVYEGIPLSELRNKLDEAHSRGFRYWNYMHEQYLIYKKPPVFNIKSKTPLFGRKFKNSYCSACNSPSWLGCSVGKIVDFLWDDPMRESDKKLMIALYKQYKAGIKNFMFVFFIDNNDRSCVRDSDSYVVYPHVDSGRDTCMKITQHLRQCDEGSKIDISLNTCAPLCTKQCLSLAIRSY